MAFPRINALSFWLLPLGGLLMASGFLASGGAAASGWTEYPPLSGATYSGTGTDLWIMGLVLIGTASILRRHQLPGHDLQDARARDDPVPDADPASGRCS